MMAARGEWRASLRLTFATVLSATVTATALVIIGVTYLSARANTLMVSRSIIDKVGDLTRERLRSFLEPPRVICEVTIADLQAGVLGRPAAPLEGMSDRFQDDDPYQGPDLAALEAHFFNILCSYPTLSVIDYGDRFGNFLMVRRQANGSLSTKTVLTDPGGERSVRWKHRIPLRGIGEVNEQTDDPLDTFDPRTRDWYLGAADSGRFFWTDVYVFHTDQEGGITGAAPFVVDGRLEGVVSVDIGLAELSRFLASLEIGAHGVAVLLDQERRILASPCPGDLVIGIEDEGGNTTIVPRPLSHSSEPAVAALAGLPEFEEALAALAGDPRTLRFTVQGTAYFGIAQPIPFTVGKDWAVVVVAPEDDFLGDVKRLNNRNLLLATAFTGAALLLSLLIAGWISSSLKLLVTETRRIGALDFASDERVPTRFVEVHDVLTAFDHMKVGLRGFQKYLPVKLVRTLLEKHEEPTLSAEIKKVSLYFSDIAGFTTAGEQLSPDQLARRLGDYLAQLSHAIQDEQGTVVEYVGDQIFAMWGAPQPVDNHPYLACRTALICQKVADTMWADDEDAPCFATRMGIHTCEVAVGHFGAEDRMYYGAIGDGVNLCSRLEGANKLYGTKIIISDSTYAKVKDSFDTRMLDLVVVKGRVKPTRIYELIAFKGKGDGEQMRAAVLYEEAWQMHRERQWEDALARLQEVLAITPQDLAATTLQERCHRYRQEPPTDDWDGSLQLLSK